MERSDRGGWPRSSSGRDRDRERDRDPYSNYKREQERKAERRNRRSRSRSPERRRHLSNRHEPPPRSFTSRGHDRKGIREYSPEPVRKPSLAKQYDSLFENADWYNGLKPAAAAPEAAPAASSAAASAESKPASEATTQELLDDIAAQKQRMLEQFLHGLPAAAASTSAAEAAPAAAPTVAASSSSTTDSGSGTLEPSPGALKLRSFMDEIGAEASPDCGTAVFAAAGAPSTAAQSGDGAAPASEEDVSPKRKRGPRLRLHEMRVSHVLSCLRRLGLEQYAPAFEQSQVDGTMCDFLDSELLEFQLGVTEPSHRHKFLQWVASMQKPGEDDAPAHFDRLGSQGF